MKENAGLEIHVISMTVNDAKIIDPPDNLARERFFYGNSFIS